jgi:hypothetical protein
MKQVHTNINGGCGRRWKQVLVIGGQCIIFFAEYTFSSKNNKEIQLVRQEDLDHKNTLHKQGQDGRMKFKHLCGRRNLPKKLEEQQVNAGELAFPSSLASWGRDETDASCATSDEAGSGQGIHKRDAKSRRPARNESFV